MYARGTLPLPVLLLALASGCNSPPPAKRLNAPPQGPSERTASLADPFVYMTDNALLYDMSVADFHFIPHTTELSGTGVARLTRLSPLLSQYGGIVRYETFEKDEKLVGQRLAHVQEFLVQDGCDMSRVEVKAMLSGGRGMRATQAIYNDMRGTAEPSGSTSPVAPGAPAAASSGS